MRGFLFVLGLLIAAFGLIGGLVTHDTTVAGGIFVIGCALAVNAKRDP